MVFFITQAIILVIFFGLLYLITWFLPTDSPWTPWWATSSGTARKIFHLAKLKKQDLFYELGSGTGTTCIVAAKEFGVKAVGIESSKSRVWWSRLKVRLFRVLDKTEFIQKDFFSVDLSPASVVYLYLVPRVIKKLKPKLLKELKPGTKVISYIYKVDYLSLIKEDTKEQIYIYQI